MKATNLKILVTLLSLLISLLLFGCVQNTSSGDMGSTMNTMEESMDTMQQPGMNDSMGTMDDSKMMEPKQEMMDKGMENSMDEMKKGTTEESMGGMEKTMK